MPDNHTIALPDGETLSVPAEFQNVVERSLGHGVLVAPNFRRDFADRLVANLREAGFYLVPTIRSTSKEAVNIDLYSLALTRKAAAERHLKLAADMLFPVVLRDDGEGLQSLDVRELLRPIYALVGEDRATLEHHEGQIQRAIERLDMAHEILCEHPPGTVAAPQDLKTRQEAP